MSAGEAKPGYKTQAKKEEEEKKYDLYYDDKFILIEKRKWQWRCRSCVHLPFNSVNHKKFY